MTPLSECDIHAQQAEEEAEAGGGVAHMAGVEVEVWTRGAGVDVRTEVKTVDRTGVEMEALTAAAAAALTVYDMCKSIDRGMVVESLQLEHKSGGRTGTWQRSKKKARR